MWGVKQLQNTNGLRGVWGWARGVRALVAWAYSLAWQKARFHLRWHGKGGTKTWRVFQEEMSTKGVQVGEKTTTKACTRRTCSTWNSSQSFAKNHHRHTLISLWPTTPPQGGGKKHHYGNNNKRWRAPKSWGETHLRVSQSQVAESETWKHALGFQL